MKQSYDQLYKSTRRMPIDEFHCAAARFSAMAPKREACASAKQTVS